MLQLSNIVKTYTTGELTQNALNDVSVTFRESEFVSILGPSGSGKTTLLNIIGGLDRYTSGDLRINGVSTKEYKDSDWDYYRNNSIGFVFQSYNLIPHQSILANVELALTLAGVSKKERRERAVNVLKKVGLGNHLHKKPNQMSGGQMQRVAIARALVNNPDILLADEPTGALDSETSVQIMELLKEIAKDKLVIMVTHNPELAERYSTRIVRLLDGKIVSDSNPCSAEEEPVKETCHKKISMSFFTALSLSFNNLRTKKGRTLLTAFAGSIGIIGIALILALSTGMNAYIEDVQKETMASYPITISSETLDVSGLLGMRAQIVGEKRESMLGEHENRSGVFADYSALELSEKMTTSIVENNLTEFKKYLDDPDSELRQYLGENGIVYSYDVNFSVYSHDADGNLINSDADTDSSGVKTSGFGATMLSRISGGSEGGAENFSELMPGAEGQAVSQVVTDGYEVLYGNWPEAYDEVVLVLDRNNSLTASVLYQLGLITYDQYADASKKIEDGGEAEEIRFSYEEVCDHVFYLVPACDQYVENEDLTFALLDEAATDEETLLENAVELKIVGIVRSTEDATNTSISTAVGYTSMLTEYIIDHTNDSAIVQAQEENPEVNVLTGMQFESPDDGAKAEDAKEYLSGLGISEKAYFYKLMMYYSQTSGQEQVAEEATEADSDNVPVDETVDGEIPANMPNGSGEIPEGIGTTDGEIPTDGNAAMGMAGAMPTDETSMAAALDQWLAGDPDRDILLIVYEEYIAGSTYEDNLKAFGKVSYDAPSSISIYTDSFENKDAISLCIEHYNEGVEDSARITYTDYVALLTSSITTIIDGISYVLIAFVAISLVVSCIMIGIITHISVMERTKEIGILSALGASKSNISQVFNAETFIIGCCAGVLGIGVSLLLLFPINSIIAKLSGLTDLTAQLPLQSSLVLILISIVITIIGGLLPAKKAAKKDPVIALRTE